MAVTTTTQVDPEVEKYFDRVLLDREEPFFIYMLFAQNRSLPQKNSKTVTFRRYDNLTDALSPLTEGVNPAFETVTKFDIDAVVSTYGNVVALSDDVIVYVQDETANEVADMLSQNMFSTFDKITRNVLDATSSQIDCLNGVNGNAVTELTQTDLDLAIDYLMGNNARRMAPVIEGTNKFGTAPIDRAYWAMCDTDIRSDVKALSTFIATNEYPTQQAVLQSELGSTEEVRWVMSTEGAVTSSIYSNFIVGMNAYAIVDVDNVSANLILKPLGSGEDALNRRQTMGWKGRFAAVILDDGWIVNLRSTKA